MNNEIIKTCKIHGDLTLKDLKIGKYKNKTYRKCHKCELDRSKKYYAKIFADIDLRDKKRKKDHDYWENNKDKIKKRRKENFDKIKNNEQREKYSTYYKSHWNEKQKSYRNDLHDTYLKRLIQNGNKNIPLHSIPKEMIELKRSLVKVKRFMKFMRINENEHKD